MPTTSPKSAHKPRAVWLNSYPKIHSSEAQLAFATYRAFVDLPGHEPKFWRNPEEFLCKLDDAADSANIGTASYLREAIENADRKVISRNLRAEFSDGIDFAELSVAARRIMAAECSAFLCENKPTGESWLPFERWIKAIDDNHTIVTFNYDRVVEILSKAYNRPIRILLPHQSVESLDGDGPLLLKLHGSVDWKKTAQGEFAIAENPAFALRAEAGEMVIATPGNSKTSAISALYNIWGHATARIRSAEVIVFIGYRFPESDARARVELLEALGRSDISAYVLVVLGANSVDATRLETMISLASPRATIDVVNLTGQEYLTTYQKSRFG